MKYKYTCVGTVVFIITMIISMIGFMVYHTDSWYVPIVLGCIFLMVSFFFDSVELKYGDQS